MNSVGSDSDSFDSLDGQQEVSKVSGKSTLTQEKIEKSHLIGEIYDDVSDFFDLKVTPMDHRAEKISPQTDSLSSHGLENAIKGINDHEKRGTNPARLVNELASLKNEIDMCDKKMEEQTLSLTKVAYFVSKYFSLGGIGYASLLYNRTLNRLSEEQKNNVIALSVSYAKGPMTLSVKNLILPEGKGVYSGRVENGVPYGIGEVKNLILREGKGVYSGALLNGVPHGEGEATDFVLTEGVLYTGPLSNGSPDGKGVVFTKDCVFENEYLHGELVKSKRYEYIENVKLVDGTYTGFTHKDMPAKQGILRKYNNEIHVGEFLNGKLIDGVIFLEDGTMLSTVVDSEKSASFKAIGKFEPGIFDYSGVLFGEGEIIKQDGTIVRGNFYEGKLDGYGERDFKAEDGTIVSQKGMFENGVFIEKRSIVVENLNNEI